MPMIEKHAKIIIWLKHHNSHMVLAPVLQSGGKPSTWFPPEVLEQRSFTTSVALTGGCCLCLVCVLVRFVFVCGARLLTISSESRCCLGFVVWLVNTMLCFCLVSECCVSCCVLLMCWCLIICFCVVFRFFVVFIFRFGCWPLQAWFFSFSFQACVSFCLCCWRMIYGVGRLVHGLW